MDGSDGTIKIDANALAQLLAPEAKLRLVAAVLEEGADNETFNPAAVHDRDGVSRDAWYRYHEDLVDYGVIEQDGKIGNSPVYRLADTDLVQRLYDVAELVSEN
ncbi:hypothetical protein [Natrinema pallidum]|uniref:hypothetical protein n=1 Tax=Natrinema pallidum TaxID=69527 RepID=UPI0037532843